MGPKSKTKAQREYANWVHEQPCEACMQKGLERPAEQHHVVQGFKRLGEEYSVPICEWHHRGVPVIADSARITENRLGPSLARNKRAFMAEFGTELELALRVRERWEQT